MRTPVLCGVVALAALSIATPAHATYPGGKGEITFVDSESDRGDAGFTDLTRLSPKGKTLGSLVHCRYDQGEGPATGCASSGASYSRSGKSAAFAIDNRLAVSAADGTSRVVLPKLTDEDSQPAWTRDGKLVFTGRKGGKANLYFVNADGSGLRQFTQSGGATPAASNRGMLAYSARGYVRLVKSDGTGGRRLARGTNPDFSPSGKTVVYERRGALYRISIRKHAKRHRVARKGRDPVFSPTGTRVLYIGPGHEDTDLLDTVSPRGKSRHKVHDPHTETAVEAEGLSAPGWQPRR
jgi:WD40-like Beta Propeller Repeat